MRRRIASRIRVLSRSVSASSIADLDVYNIYIVFATTATATGVMYGEGLSSNNNPFVQAQINAPTAGNVRGVIRDGTDPVTTFASSGRTANDGAAHLLTIRHIDAQSWELRLDGESVATGLRDLGTVSINRIAIGALVRASTSSYFTGTIGLVALVDDDVYAAAEARLASHYGITLYSQPVPFEALALGGTVNPNSVHFRDAAIASRDGYQAMAWWTDAAVLALAARSLGGTWRHYAYNNTGGFPPITVGADIHNVANIGIDRDGYLHVAYNMHNVALKYRRSVAPLATWYGGLTDELAMLGTNEASVTYPTFFNAPDGTLYFMFRDGGSGNGDLYFYVYDETSETWSAATGTSTGGKLIDGKNSTGVHSPYWDCPVFDEDFGAGGFMHLSWCWRDTTLATSNHDYSYMRWDGTNWTTVDGNAQTIPVTTANNDVFDPVASGGGLSNQNGLDADSAGHPHVAYFKDDGDGDAQLYHAWHNGTAWVILQLTDTATPSFGAGSSFLDMGRPTLMIDRDTDTIYILYRDDADADGVLMLTSAPGDFTQWTQSVIHAEDVGFFEPNYDRERWLAEKKIVMQLAPWFDTNAASFTVSVFEYTP